MASSSGAGELEEEQAILDTELQGGEDGGGTGEDGQCLLPESEADTCIATGTIQEGDADIDDLSDLSDTGWDTDLDIEEGKEDYDSTGKSLYVDTCKILKIIPAHYFLNVIQNVNTHITMHHHGLGPKGAKAIAVSLTSNTTVTHLDLSDNGLGTEGCIAITNMMKENCYITFLDLSDNDAAPPSAFAVKEMMASNTTLTHLVLRGNGFNDKTAEPLSDVIRTTYHIKHLDLSHNELGEAAGMFLGPAIGDSESILILNLSWNHLRKKGAEAIADGIKVNTVLKELNLAYNGFADKGVASLAEAMKVNSTLQKLDVSNNRVSYVGATAISKIIPSHDGLQTLKIGKNPLQPAGITALLNAASSSSSTTFQLLDLDGITITIDIEKTIKGLQETHQHLSVSHGGVGGFKVPKPLLPPTVKLVQYCKENKVELMDLFRLFDKEQRMILSEEDFRSALKHISSPLMEFERLKLIKEFKTNPPKSEGEGEEAAPPPPPPPEEGAEPPIFIDYMVLVGVTKEILAGKLQNSTS